MTYYNYRIQDVLDIVSKEAGICKNAIKGPRRTLWISRHRQIVMFLLRRYTTKSTTQIARALCVSDHSTVVHANRVVTKLIKDNDDWRRLVDRLERQLKSEAPTVLKAEHDRLTKAAEKPKSKKVMKRPSIRKPSNDELKDGLQQQQKKRTCLNAQCGTEFLSLHFGNRFCPTCTKHRKMTGSADPRFEGVAI